MYFFKFISWYWNEHLKNDTQRANFIVCTILVGLVPTFILIHFFGQIVLIWYFGSLGSGTVLFFDI